MGTDRPLLVSGILIGVLILIEVVFVHHHAHFWWHEVIGFDVIYGLLGCLVLIVVSKGLGKLFIQRKEDYYDGGEDLDE